MLSKYFLYLGRLPLARFRCFLLIPMLYMLLFHWWLLWPIIAAMPLMSGTGASSGSSPPLLVVIQMCLSLFGGMILLVGMPICPCHVSNIVATS